MRSILIRSNKLCLDEFKRMMRRVWLVRLCFTRISQELVPVLHYHGEQVKFARLGIRYDIPQQYMESVTGELINPLQ